MEKVNDDNSYAIEINTSQNRTYGIPGGIDPGLYTKAIVNWKLTGRREDIIAHNELEIYKASATVPTVAYAVRNFLEFAQITLG